MDAKDTNYRSMTVQKALNILNLFRNRQKLSFTTIQRELDLNKSTLFRLLYTLERNKYLVRDENGWYRLGLNIFVLGNSVSRESQIKKAAVPYMQEIARQLNLTVQLGVIEGHSVIILHKIDLPNSIKMFSRVGIAVPAHCTGQGKALLAFSPRQKVNEVIDSHGLKRYTPHTLTTVNELFAELEAIQQRGYAVDNSEHERHIKCVAVPLLNDQKWAEASLSVTGLAVDFDEEGTVERYAALLQEAAEKITRELGLA